jgi:Ca-activated chloride channel family protein
MFKLSRVAGLGCVWFLMGVMGCAQTGRGEAGSAQTARTAEKPSPVAEQKSLTIAARSEANVAAQNSWIGLAASSDYLHVGEREQELALWVDAGERSETRLPVFLVLSIDTSGSMEGEKLQQARHAARRLLESLHDGDIVAIHSFDGSVRRHARATRLDRHTRAALIDLVSELGANGSTNLFEGVRQAEAEATFAPETHAVRRVVILSDGKATTGETSPAAIAAEADVGVPHGVQVTSLGVGLDYDETALNALALRSNGRLFHIANATDLVRVVQKEVSLLDNTVATRAAIELVPAPGVRIVKVSGAEPQLHGDGKFLISLGTLHAMQSREFVVKVSLDEAQRGTRALLAARLVYRDPQTNGLERVQEQIFRATFTSDESLVAAHANSRGQTILARLHAAELTQVAANSANSGDLGSADRALLQAEEKLQASFRSAKGAEKERIAEDVRRVARARTSTQKAAAAPAASRPRAARAGSLELNDLGMDLRGF